jgi:hypothetical protein
MPLTPEAQAAAVRTARETVKAFALAELGIDIGQMQSHEALTVALAAVIVKLQARNHP